MMSQSLLKHVSSLLYQRRVWISDPKMGLRQVEKEVFLHFLVSTRHTFDNFSKFHIVFWTPYYEIVKIWQKNFVQSAFNPFLHTTYGIYLLPKLKPRYRVCTRFITTQNWRQTTQTNCVTRLLLKLDRIASVDNIQLRILKAACFWPISGLFL